MQIDLVLAQGFGGFWQLVANMGPVALLVLLVLAFFSVFSWAIIAKKWRAYQQVEAESQEFFSVFQKKASLSEIHKECDHYPMSPLAGMFKTGYRELHRQLGASRADERESPSASTALRSLDSLQRALQKAAQNEMTALERSLDWLATTGSVTPFIGLFGTVVGIINAFQGLGEGTGTTIQAVAPGISEALVATAAGLFAAIPAVVFYNHFIHRLKVFGAEMDDFSAEVLNTVESSLL